MDNKGLVGCFGFDGPLRQYFSLCRAVSDRGRRKKEKIDDRKTAMASICLHADIKSLIRLGGCLG